MSKHFPSEHESVCYCSDPASGLNAIIAIHSTKFGPALGGTRIFPYVSEDDALADVLNLSRAMTYKAAAADLPYGGGKAVILADPESPRKREMLKAYCRFVNLLNGAFQTGEDVGIALADVEYMRKFTTWAHYTPVDLPDWLETSALTARGVLCGIEASLQHRFGSPAIQGRTIAIQGLGKVGMNLARFLAEKGARLVVCDVRPAVVDTAVKSLGCRSVDASAILGVEADVFSPCAMGNVLTPQTIGVLRAPIVAGCANNQLSEDGVAESLRQRKVLYAPDYVINSGGLISALFEMKLEDETKMVARVDAIGERLLRIYSQADGEGISTLEAINRIVRAKLQ